MKTSTFFFLLFCCISFASTAQYPLTGEDSSKFYFAKDLMDEGKYQDAIDYCDHFLEGRRNADVYLLRAKAYRAIGNYEEAEKSYSEALQTRRDPDLYQARGMVNFCLKNFDKALQDFNEAIRLLKENQSDNNFILYEERGRTYHQLGNYKDAISDFSTAIEKGSFTANIDMLASLFRYNLFGELQGYCKTILNDAEQNGFSAAKDSSILNYVNALNILAQNKNAESALNYIDAAIRNYSSYGKSCFQGLLNDMICTKAYVCFITGRDSLAYELYKKVYNANTYQAEVKPKLDLLKIKIGIDITPPEISIVNPPVDANNMASITTDKTSVDIYGKIKDSSGIASLTVNDKSISKLEEDGVFVVNLDLQPGPNQVTITAVDKYDNTATKKISINVIAGNAQADDTANIPELFTYANYHAILIGEKDYEDPGFEDLAQPAVDANDLKNILTKDYEFNEKNVVTLISADKVKILNTIDSVSSSLSDDDNLLIFYGGHGTVKKVGNQIFGAYVIPSDAKKGSWATYISSDALKESIEGSPAKHILFVVDACFGGALLRSVLDDAPPNIKNIYSLKSRHMLTSGNQQEEVPDQGTFMKNLKTFLTANTQKYVPASDLYTFLLKHVDETTPQFGEMKDVESVGGQFIFIHK